MSAAQRRRFGEALALRRKFRGMSQTALGRALGVSHSYVSHLEAGRREPSVALLYRIAEELGGAAGGYLP